MEQGREQKKRVGITDTLSYDQTHIEKIWNLNDSVNQSFERTWVGAIAGGVTSAELLI